MTREARLLWIRDLLEHGIECQQHLELAEDGHTSQYLTDALLCDLMQCQRLCETLQREASVI